MDSSVEDHREIIGLKRELKDLKDEFEAYMEAQNDLKNYNTRINQEVLESLIILTDKRMKREKRVLKKECKHLKYLHREMEVAMLFNLDNSPSKE